MNDLSRNGPGLNYCIFVDSPESFFSLQNFSGFLLNCQFFLLRFLLSLPIGFRFEGDTRTRATLLRCFRSLFEYLGLNDCASVLCIVFLSYLAIVWRYCFTFVHRIFLLVLLSARLLLHPRDRSLRRCYNEDCTLSSYFVFCA